MKSTKELVKPDLPLGRHGKTVGAMAFILILIVSFSPWITFTVGQGQITAIDPSERVQSISATVDGFISGWHVKEGETVEEGQVIADLIDNDPSRLVRLTEQKEAARDALESANLMMMTSEIDFRRQELLFKQGLSSRKNFELAKIKFEKHKIDRAKNIADLAKAETEFSRQSSQRIIAPRKGIITRILPGEKNQLIKSGTPIVVFTPIMTRPAVEVWIDGNDAAYLSKGMKAQVQFEGWPSIQIPGWPALAINTFEGVVYLVDQASSYDGKFRVLLTPAANWPSQNLLRLGMNARSYIKIRDSFVIREVWRIMNGFPPLQEPINDELNKILSPKPTYQNVTTERKI